MFYNNNYCIFFLLLHIHRIYVSIKPEAIENGYQEPNR